MKKKVLTLTVSKQWFDMIVAGEKKEEYRTIKGYWTVRLYDVFAKNPTKYLMDKKINGDIDYLKLMIRCNHFIAKQYTHVLFINGYRKDSPRIEKEIESISIGKPKKGLCPDKWLDTEFFIIKFKQRMKQKKVELCVPGSLIWSQIDDYLDTDLIGGGKRVRHSGRAIREILESGMII